MSNKIEYFDLIYACNKVHTAEQLKALQAMPLDAKVIANDMLGLNIPLVFSNTGLEYSEIQKFAKAKGAEFIRPEMQFTEVISTYGYPLISKEVAEAIYYARRIRNEGGAKQSPENETRCKARDL